MKKNVYIFNGCGTIDGYLCLKVFREFVRIIDISCNKYCFVFKDRNNKHWSRNGAVKNMEQNFSRYLSNDIDNSRLVAFEIYNQPDGTKAWQLEKRICGVYFDELDNSSFNFYLVVPGKLSKGQVVSLWEAFINLFNIKYMVSFALDMDKKPEIFMYGRPICPASANMNTYYSDEEKLIVLKLHSLRLNKTSSLDNVFSSCIISKEISIKECDYPYKEAISLTAVYFSK